MDDYISREAAYNAIVNNHTIDTELRDLYAIPAADVAPVVHGRWIKSPDCPEQYDICSVCGMNDKHRSRGDADHPAFESIPPFCKWCGAKMDGGRYR